jgi:hypothetical protein
LHASVCPEEALEFADYVFVGEGEQVWPMALPAIAAGTRQRLWRSEDFPPVNLDQTPTPRYDLLLGGNWNRIPLQTTRGCPWRCDFCASSIMLGRPYRKRPIARILSDLDTIQGLWKRPFIELADDNTFVDPKWGRALCRALIPRRLKWFTETDISVADDDELLSLLRPAGCRQLLIGLESPDANDLAGVELVTDFKHRRGVDYVEAVRRIQRAGVSVNGCFVLGLDSHGPRIFQRIFEYAMEIPLYEVGPVHAVRCQLSPQADERRRIAARIPMAGGATLFSRMRRRPPPANRRELVAESCILSFGPTFSGRQVFSILSGAANFFARNRSSKLAGRCRRGEGEARIRKRNLKTGVSGDRTGTAAHVFAAKHVKIATTYGLRPMRIVGRRSQFNIEQVKRWRPCSFRMARSNNLTAR